MPGWTLLVLACGSTAERPIVPEPPEPTVLAEPLARWTAGPLGEVGVTTLESAPFPHPRKPYQDGSVLLFVPEGAGQGASVDVLVHFHGFESVLEPMVAAYRLVEQVAGSGRDMVLVVPQGPLNARDNDFGKLMEPGGMAALVDEALQIARHDGRIRAEQRGRLVVSAHSGGYRAAARAVTHGGVPVDQVLLFDALYGELDAFQAYVLDGGRLVSSHTAGGGTRRNNVQLANQLREAGVRVGDDLLSPGPVTVGATELDHNTTLRDGSLQDWLSTP